MSKPSDLQYGGDHYKDMAIQPTEFITLNHIPFPLGCAIKYCSRVGRKGDRADALTDLQKAKHFIDLYAEYVYGVDLNQYGKEKEND